MLIENMTFRQYFDTKIKKPLKVLKLSYVEEAQFLQMIASLDSAITAIENDPAALDEFHNAMIQERNNCFAANLKVAYELIAARENHAVPPSKQAETNINFVTQASFLMAALIKQAIAPINPDFVVSHQKIEAFKKSAREINAQASYEKGEYSPMAFNVITIGVFIAMAAVAVTLAILFPPMAGACLVVAAMTLGGGIFMTYMAGGPITVKKQNAYQELQNVGMFAQLQTKFLENYKYGSDISRPLTKVHAN